MYDIVVVGAGLWGSSAAKHLCLKKTNKKIALIGPQETRDEEKKFEKCRAHSFDTAYGCHLDQGRIMKQLDGDDLITELSKAQCSAVSEIQYRTSSSFVRECGLLYVCPKGSEYLDFLSKNASDHALRTSKFDATALRSRFPFLHITDDHTSVLTTDSAGFFNPRSFISSQVELACQHGCIRINDVVSSINTRPGGFHILTKTGRSLATAEILVAAGSNSKFLLSDNFDVFADCKLLSQTTGLLEIPNDMVYSLRDMPCIVTKKALSGRQRDKRGNREKLNLYIIPPTKYPNGKYYLKFGHGDDFENELFTRLDVNNWYRCGGSKHAARTMLEEVSRLIPGIGRSLISDSCVTCHTPSSYPYIDYVRPGLAVAFGGNGRGAKFSDTIGKIAAELVICGKWNSKYPKEQFTFKALDHSTSKL